MSKAMPPVLSEDVIERAFVDADSIRDAWRLSAVIEAEALEVEAASKTPGEGLRALVALLGERGLLGLVVPAAYGGTNEHVRSVPLCLARERLGYASPLVELAFAMQGLGSYAITARGSDAQKAEYLPYVAAGTRVAAFALTEENAGSDLSRIATEARRDGDGYVLTGKKVYISNAGVADFYVVFAKLKDAKDPKRDLTAFIVDATLPNVRTTAQQVLGGHPIGALHLEGVFVGADKRIGGEGEGLSTALETLHKFRMTVGAAALGFAQRALSETLDHVQHREQFGAPLGQLQAVQMQLAEMACELEAARLLVYRAASLADVVATLAAQNGQENAGDRARVAKAGSMAKLVATENASRIIDKAVQLHGGRGVDHDFVVSRLYEDVRALRIYEGASDIQKLLIARHLLTERSAGRA
jgi:acyl-CoA dehydrogenase